jgi:hypothetical protein
MDPVIYSKLLENGIIIAERINSFKCGYCCYEFNTEKIIRHIIHEPVFEETEICIMTKEIEFIINKFSYVLNTTIMGYWIVFYACPSYIWFKYTQLPNLTIISTEVSRYVSSKMIELIKIELIK